MGSSGIEDTPLDREVVFPGESETAGLGRTTDWSATSLGAIDSWAPALRTAVQMMLESPFPMNLWCGRDLILIYNDGYRDILGSKHPRAFGRSGKEVWSEVWPVIGSWFDEIRAGGPAVYAEDAKFMIERVGGEPADAWFTFALSPVRDDAGTVVAFFNVVTETTGRVYTEAELKRLTAEATDANRAKSDFLAAMSHELRTPLNAIGGYAQLIEMGVRGPVTEQQHVYLAKIQRSKDHLDSLVGDVLNFAKLGAGRVEFNIEDIDVRETLDAVLDMVAPQVAEKELDLTATVPAPGLTMVADADKTRQILLNLIANALKFTPPGGTIALDARTNGRVVAISVSDTGIGVPAEQLERIFEPFVQAKRALHPGDHGVGLGLAISRQLAHSMDGDLTVESSVGIGSTFTLTLPLRAR